MNEPIEEALTISNTKARAEIYGRQGDLFREKGDLNETITAYINSIKLDSTNQDIWIKFANTIKFVQFSTYNETIKQILTTGLSRAGICHQHFAIPAISLLKLAYQIELGNLKLLEDKLFVRLLEKTLLPNQEIENLLTSIRRSLLETAAKDHFLTLPKASLKFLYALSRNCFYNEFVFAEQQSETIALDQLFGFLNSQETIDLSQFKFLVALYGCYRPLQMAPFATKLIKIVETELDPEFSALIEEQVKEPLDEEQISAQIPLLKSISDAVSAKVSSQYEENPYPRWKTIDKAKPKSSERLEILIAGCGTGQHAINTAICYPESHLLAIDLSKKSLAYAARKAKELKISNIKFLQADLLDLEALGRTFDLIESVGVLHHLEDPVRGWRILTALLKPQGRMEIGLYSGTARQDVASAKALIKEKGYRATSEDIRRCRQDIFKLSPADPIHDLSLGVDFYSLSACRDLLFHVQEQCFTLQQIAAILQELGLNFLGLDIRDRSVMRKYLQQFGETDPQALSLEHWQQFEIENPHTFIGMYSFWCRKMSHQFKRCST